MGESDKCGIMKKDKEPIECIYLYMLLYVCVYTVDPWTIRGLNCMCPHIHIHTCLCVFLNKYLYWFWFKYGCGGLSYSFISTILYRGLEHPQILISVCLPRTNPSHIIEGQLKFWGSQKLNMDFWLCMDLMLLTPASFNGPLCVCVLVYAYTWW